MFAGRENVLAPYRLLPNSWHTFSRDGTYSPMGAWTVFMGKKIKRNNSKELKQHSLHLPKNPPPPNSTGSLDRKHSEMHKSSSAPLFLPCWMEKWRICPFPCEWVLISEWALLYPAVGNLFGFDQFCSLQVALMPLGFCLVLVSFCFI